MISNLITDLADHISDAISDHALSTGSRGPLAILTFDDWVACKECGHADENQSEIQHSGTCPVGWFQDLVDDVRNPKLKETG